MAALGEARALLAGIDQLRQQVEPLDDPARPLLLSTLRILRDQAEAVVARATDEAARVSSGVGAMPRYARLR